MGIEVSFDETGDEKPGNEIPTTVSRSGPPGAEVMIGGSAPTGQRQQAEPFKSADDMQKAYEAVNDTAPYASTRTPCTPKRWRLAWWPASVSEGHGATT